MVARWTVRVITLLTTGLVCSAVWAGVLVTNPYLYPTPPGAVNAAVYFELHNEHDSPLVLIGATAEGVGEVQIHGHQMTDGMMGMRQYKQLVVGSGAKQTFAPGGYHLMLLGLDGPLRTGERIRIELTFAENHGVTLSVPVVELGATPQSAQQGSTHQEMHQGAHHRMGHGDH